MAISLASVVRRSSAFGAGKVRSVASAKAHLAFWKAASASVFQVRSLGLPLRSSLRGASMEAMFGRNLW